MNVLDAAERKDILQKKKLYFNYTRPGNTPAECKWRSCTKCNSKHQISACVKPPIRILPDKVQDKSKEACWESFSQK